MAQPLRVALLAGLRSPQPARLLPREAAWRYALGAPNFYTTASQDAPPLLEKLKGDLKSAMRAKDAPRLAVLRAIMSANLNASKTATPIQTDVQLVALMRKIQKGAEEAAAEAKTAGREDLVDKEVQQIRILQDYLASSGVESLGETQLKALVQDAVAASQSAGTAAKALVGDVMKRLSGALAGKDVDKKQVIALVKELAGQ
ncbi:yqey-like protein [Hirsutella rhossiliensis]|uniref:Altered inheritance of mitochondria protein 41 n=1 Tax=Hirsutella rhossiliensis TaxID=111463 RepID=A0A9P8N4F3_9HYPO|nr:yqey-like protein [Hirsutella rhossiliensis]KAH0966624.1 yqey-like protein [Hirsutella rhossiliensis]